MSEKKIGETFHNLFKDAKGRIIIAMFASNLHRIQQVVDNCIEFGRKICFVGRSMVNVTKLAMEIGELKIPQDVFIDVGDLDCYEDDEIVVLTTGSQGEPMSGLTRMANSEHRKLQIRQGDTVIISATPIPGNEIMVSRIIDQLYRCGANVIYNRIADVHVSGHACQEELKLMHTLVKPKYFIPVHGEYRMLHRHAHLAQELGMPEDNVIILEMGQALELSGRGEHHRPDSKRLGDGGRPRCGRRGQRGAARQKAPLAGRIDYRRRRREPGDGAGDQRTGIDLARFRLCARKRGADFRRAERRDERLAAV